jgi:hypothetical protein
MSTGISISLAFKIGKEKKIPQVKVPMDWGMYIQHQKSKCRESMGSI